MFEIPEMIIVFRKDSVETITPPSSQFEFMKMMPELNFLAHVLSVIAVGIMSLAVSYILFGFFLFFIFVYLLIRDIRKCDSIKIFIYKNKIITHGITSEGFSTSMGEIGLILFLCFAFTNPPPITIGEVVFLAFVFLCMLTISYFGWDKSYLIDFPKRKISRRYLLFNKPYETFDYIGGIDRVFNYFDSTRFFYKLWIRDERYAMGIPLSGYIRKGDAELQKIYADNVLEKFGTDDQKKTPVESSSSLINKYLTLKLKSGAHVTVSQMSRLFVYSDFMRPSGASCLLFAWLRLLQIKVIIRKGLDENVVLMKFGPGDSKEVDKYIQNLSNTFSIQPEIILLDDRL